MDNEQLLVECKKGLNIPIESNAFDGTLMQKIKAVTMFMTNAGVSSENLGNDLAIGAIVLGVSDLWELKTGEVKFSPVFYIIVNQLALG
jgi:hypothetical protein